MGDWAVRSRRDVWVLSGLAAVVFGFFLSKWLLDGLWFVNDLVVITAPLENLHARIQRAGQSLLWTPEIAGGFPLLAHGQTGFFYPPHALLRLVLPGPWLMNVSLLLHGILATVGMFLFLRENRCSRFAAALGSLLLFFGGAIAGRWEMTNVVFSFAWLPLLLFLLQRWIEQRRWGALWFWSLASALHVFVGHPPFTVLVHGMELLFLMTFILPRPPLGRFLAIVGAGALAVLVTLPHTLPLRELLPETERASGVSSEDLFDYSFPPALLRGLVIPHPFGHGPTYHGPEDEAELAAFLGPGALLLSVLGMSRAWRQHRRLLVCAILWLLVAILLAPGRFSPLYVWLVEEGFWRHFRVPARFFVTAHIALVVLAAVGADTFLAWLRKQPMLGTRGVLGGVVLLPVLVTAWTWYPGVPWAAVRSPPLAAVLAPISGARLHTEERLSDVAPHDNFGMRVWDPVCADCLLRQTFVAPFSHLNAVAVRFAQPRRAGPPGTLRLRLLSEHRASLREVTVPSTEIIDGEWTTFSFPPLRDVRDARLTVELTSDLPGPHAPRVYIHTNPERIQYDPTGELSACRRERCAVVRSDDTAVDLSFELRPETDPVVLPYELLAPHTAAGFGIGSIQGVGAYSLDHVTRFVHDIQRIGMDRALTESRSLVNRFPVTHVAGAYPPHRELPPHRGIERVAIIERGGMFLHLYRNAEAFPHLHLAERVVAQPDSDAQRRALLTLPADDPTTVTANLTSDRTFAPGTATLVGDLRSRVIVTTETSGEGFLVLRETFSRGWEAQVDGMPIPLWLVDGAFRGVVVPPGKHRVEFRYAPSWVQPATVGASIGAALLILWGGWILAARRVSSVWREQEKEVQG